MADGDEVVVQIATRIPRDLHLAMRLHCVKSDITGMDFTVEAIREKLRRDTRRPRKTG